MAFGLAVAAGVARAELKAEPAELDLGRIRQQKTATATVKLTNVGKTDVTIDHVTADCSCTAATPEKRDLKPGESTQMEVSFESRSYEGEVHRRVMVQSSDGDVMIPVKARVAAYDDWNLSGPILILKPTNKGEETSGTISLEYAGKGSAEVKEISASVPWIKAEIGTRQGATTELKATKLGTAPAGNHQPKLIVRTSDEHESEISIPMFLSVYSNLSLQPSPVLMPPGKIGTEAVVPAHLSNWEAKENPRFELDGGSVEIRQRDRGDLLLGITVKLTQTGTTTRLLRVYAGDNLEAEIPVIVRAE